jgi:hypothetical protein
MSSLFQEHSVYVSHLPSTCYMPDHLDLVVLIIFYEDSLQMWFLHPLVTSSLFKPNFCAQLLVLKFHLTGDIIALSNILWFAEGLGYGIIGWIWDSHGAVRTSLWPPLWRWLNKMVFWVVTPSSAETAWRFRWTFGFQLQSWWINQAQHAACSCWFLS